MAAAPLRNNERLMYAPMATRPRVTLPGGASVAFWHAPNVEHYDFIPPGGASPQGRVSAPDLQHYMHRDAGNRVGLWRMLRVVDEFEMPSTVSLSLSLLEEQPEVRDAMFSRDWEIMSHGISNLRPLYGMSYEDESAFYELSQLLSETYYGGRRIPGMLGPKISGTDNTTDLLADHGFTYFADWIHDEQPRPLRTTSENRIVSMPYSFMLNDVPIIMARSFSGREFIDLAKAQIDRTLRDAERDGQARVVCFATHPFLSGQPWFARYLAEIFAYVRADERIWCTTAGRIADHFIENHYDEQAAFAEEIRLEHAAREEPLRA
ncbi:polysaccharide deacetylase family protein [Microbacterium excoecariae]|uniref:polysaccharide deacetylase family protein n=1 Tax=Microbacterium excoecariae TaxID=2715210 RepID=UPI001408407E|nr:polysaccharide deacetylase family protein [Microbacterium excoecariae]NHI17673.1 polysaccharide deacetylase family protein [Microbacterium excoecariae]